MAGKVANPLALGPGQAAVKIAYGHLYVSTVWRLVQKTFRLTNRETQVAILVSKGLSVDEMAGHLRISRETVRTHLHNMGRILGTSKRARMQAKLTLAAMTLAEQDAFTQTLSKEPS